jgi:integrase
MENKEYQYVRKSTTYNGKRYYVRGKTEREARRKLAALEAELQANGGKLDGSTTVRRWSEEWLDVYVNSRDITKKSAAMYRQKLDNYILPEIGAMRIGDVKDIHLKRLLNKANSSYSTAQKVRIVLQAMFRQARKSRLIPFDPAEDLELPKAPKGKRHGISEWERQNILAVAEAHRSGLYVLMLLYCGLRPGEAIALQWKDIDPKDHTVDVFKALESGDSGREKAPKSDSGRRTIPIPSQLWKRLEEARRGPFDYVFVQPLGRKRHTESSINDYWNNFKRALDIHMGAEVYRNQIVRHCWEVNWGQETEEQWNALVPYSLRHTYCTDLQRAGVPINVAKYLMGHSDISVTGNIYTDQTPDVVFDAVKKLEIFHGSHEKNSLTPEMESAADRLA